MSNDMLEIDDPDYDFLYSDHNAVHYLEILHYPSLSRPIRRLEGELNDDKSLDNWLAKVRLPVYISGIEVRCADLH